MKDEVKLNGAGSGSCDAAEEKKIKKGLKLNRGVKLLILLGALAVVLTVTLIAVPKMKPEKVPIARVSGESIKQIDLTKMTNIRWTWEQEQYDFNYKDGVFTCNLQPDYMPKQDRMDVILENLRDIRAEKIIDEPMEMSVYGLDKPVCTVTIGDYEMKFGKQSVIDNTYYMSNGDGKVYMLDSKYFNAFAKTREEMVQLGAVPDMSGVTRITFENAEGTTVLVKEPNSNRTYSSHYEWFVEGSDAIISQEYVQDLIVDSLTSLEWSACLDSDPQSLTEYGLDKPVATCTAQWDGGNFTFYLGAEHDQGHYAAVKGEDRVYLLKQSVNIYTAEVMKIVCEESLLAADVLKMDWSTVTSVDVVLGGQTHTFTATDGVWKQGEETVALQDVLYRLAAMTTESAGTMPEEPVMELQLVMHRNTETFNPVTLTFYQLDGTYCVVQLDDQAPMLVSRISVVSVKEAFNTLILG